ncbi:hypothetical protein [Flammeovirga sp. SJP92]|uniref:hypothetical protein n=1 Tax=Flammeovirga sp. SJP92 TaxID=1775430 RepID=UPI0007882859|nr:hypothetical protein [Flammeovirga sp. SJP92]KXX67931.1 hypothetical protein AVL50_24040 [Flammeovirga sp. SJP92]
MKKLIASIFLAGTIMGCSDKVENDLTPADNSGFYQWSTSFNTNLIEGEDTTAVSTGTIPTAELNVSAQGDVEFKTYKYELKADAEGGLVIVDGQVQYDLFVVETKTGTIAQSLAGEFSINYSTSCLEGKDIVQTPSIKTYFIKNYAPAKQEEGGFTKDVCSEEIP